MGKGADKWRWQVFTGEPSPVTVKGVEEFEIEKGCLILYTGSNEAGEIFAAGHWVRASTTKEIQK
jgi:hypothetical protein